GGRVGEGMTRQEIYEDPAPGVRAYLHEGAVRPLLSAGAPMGGAAEHAIAAGLFGAAQAIETLPGAGRAALRAGAVQAARRYLDAAAGLAGDSAPVALQIDLAKALLGGGAAAAATAGPVRAPREPG